MTPLRGRVGSHVFDSQKADGFPVAAACHAAGVSTSAYYDWRRAQASAPSPAQQAKHALVTEIHSVHEASDGTSSAWNG